jgi:ketosteroid isomerase-like protein
MRVFRAAIDALNRADLDALRELVHPELVFHPLRAEMSGDYIGHAGIEAFLADNAETFVSFEVHYDEIRPLPDGRLFACGEARMQGRSSSVPTVAVTAGYASFKDGLVSRWRDYGDRAAALADVRRAG